MDITKFFDSIRGTVFGGAMQQPQVDGCSAILTAWGQYAPTADPRDVAYSLGTTFHETTATMQPIAEIGRGRGMAYGHPAGPWHMTFYGRGDVQLTWERNYVFATQRLRALGVIASSVNLDAMPDLAMRPEIAAPVMIFGMTEGWFTGRKLSQFFAGTRSDWVDARTIINGHDRAALVAAYAMHFYHGLTI